MFFLFSFFFFFFPFSSFDQEIDRDSMIEISPSPKQPSEQPAEHCNARKSTVELRTKRLFIFFVSSKGRWNVGILKNATESKRYLIVSN